jgi:CDP-diacylglycerol--serine O-phosphatidyltransferase
MLSNINFLALKFKDYSFSGNKNTYILAILSLVAVIVFRWLAVPVIFILYVIFSLISRPPKDTKKEEFRPELDVTV